MISPIQMEVILDGLKETDGALESGNLTHARASLTFVRAVLHAAKTKRSLVTIHPVPGLSNENLVVPKLIELLSSRYQVTREDILGRSKIARHVTVRYLSIYFSRLLLPGVSDKGLGRVFNRRHDIIAYAVQWVQNHMSEAPFRLEVAELRAELENQFQVEIREAA